LGDVVYLPFFGEFAGGRVGGRSCSCSGAVAAFWQYWFGIVSHLRLKWDQECCFMFDYLSLSLSFSAVSFFSQFKKTNALVVVVFTRSI